MPINNRSSWTSFLVALASLGAMAESGQAVESVPPSPLAARLNNLSAALQEKANQFPNPDGTAMPPSQSDLMAGFANRSGGGGFVDTRRGGWADGRGGGSFVNVNPWRNGWGDRGGFYNRGWPNGGFVNRW